MDTGFDELVGAVARLTEAIAALTERVERSEERVEAAVRTELVGMRQALRAALAGGSSPDVLARVEQLEATSAALPLDGPAALPGAAAAITAAVDQLGARVDHDVETVDRRLQTLAGVLEEVVAAVRDILSRRRGAATEALDSLRQVAAEQARRASGE